MNRRFLRAIAVSAVLTCLPLIPAMLLRPQASDTSPVEITEFTDGTEVSTADGGNVKNTGTRSSYRVLCCDTGEIEVIPVRQYILGAVAAEMPISFEPEALKAQAVAAHTYAERQCLAAAGREELGGADFSDDPSKFQAFCTQDELRERWGTHYDTNFHKLSEIVDEVADELLTYEDTPIIAAFHAMSTGRTESAENVWGSDIAYLQPVESTADEAAPQFEETVEISPDRAGDLLKAAHPALDLTGDPSGWFGEAQCSESGTVLSQRVGDGLFTGQELRSIFSLRSAAFEVTLDDGVFAFTTHGFGHDVGMSQFGANAMAQSGADYREILSHYYPGAELS